MLNTNGQLKKNGANLKTEGSIALSLTIVNPSCGYNNGSILIMPSGGVAPYTYSLSGNLQSNGYFPGLNAAGTGVYTILVKDAVGSSATTTVTLSNTIAPPNLIVTPAVLPSDCTSADGVITLAGKDGSPPYQYSIDGVTFSTVNTFSHLTQGAYIFYVQDAKGCIAKAGIGFIPGQFDCLKSCGLHCNGEGGQNGVACSDDGSLDISASGGTPPYLYSIDGTNYSTGSSNPGFSNLFTNLSSGLYHLYVKDATGVIAVSGFQILQYCGVSINHVTVNTACQQRNGSITIDANGGQPPYSYTMDGVDFQNSNIFSGLGTGSYSFSVRDATGSMYSLKADVGDNCPTVSFTDKPDTCSSGKGSIAVSGSNGTPPYKFSIDGINFQSGNLFTGLPAGSYTISVKDADGFMGTTHAEIKNNCIQLLLSTGDETCGNKNGYIVITGSNGVPPYRFSIDGLNFQSSNLFNNLAAGSYTITIKDGMGSVAISTSTIKEVAGPQITMSQSPASCFNTDGTLTIGTLGGTSPMLYSIDGGNTFYSNNFFNNLDSGRYFIVIKDANGCSKEDSIVLQALATPIVSLGHDTTLCNGSSLTLDASSPGINQYQWQDNSTAANYKVNSPGKYFVVVTNNANCKSSDTISIAYSSPVFSLGNDTSLCEGDVYNFDPVVPTGTYLWSNGSISNMVEITKPGYYWLEVSSSGCKARDSIAIFFKPAPLVNLGSDTTLCDGQTLELNATNYNATYLWQDKSTLPIFEVKNAGKYNVQVEINGCRASDDIQVKYLTKPAVELGRDTTICLTDKILLTAYYPGSTFNWQDGSTAPNLTAFKPGLYSVAVQNICGTTRDSIRISTENCSCNFYMPTAFTPNNDGNNDVFRPRYHCVFSNFECKIFNRWGQMIFISKDANKGWDGKSNGRVQPDGAFVWQISYFDVLLGKTVNKKGTILLMR